jgi:hypothetical protein
LDQKIRVHGSLNLRTLPKQVENMSEYGDNIAYGLLVIGLWEVLKALTDPLINKAKAWRRSRSS